MKIAVTIFLLVIGVQCNIAQYVTSWGNVQNTTIFAEYGIHVRGKWMQVEGREVGFIPVSEKN